MLFGVPGGALSTHLATVPDDDLMHSCVAGQADTYRVPFASRPEQVAPRPTEPRHIGSAAATAPLQVAGLSQCSPAQTATLRHFTRCTSRSWPRLRAAGSGSECKVEPAKHMHLVQTDCATLPERQLFCTIPGPCEDLHREVRR